MADIQRKGSNGRYTPEFRDHVLRWIAVVDGRSAGEAGIRWDLKVATVQRWMRDVGQKPWEPPISRESDNEKGAGKPPSSHTPGGRFRAPVDDMSQPDRDRVVNTARALAQTVELGAEAMLADLKESMVLRRRAIELGATAIPGISIDKDAAQAMLHLARTSGILVDTHPGLMKVAGIEEQTASAGRDLDDVMKALGVVAAEAK